MKLYLSNIIFHFRGAVFYKLPIFFFFLTNITEIILLIFFWSVFIDNSSQDINLKNLIGYFLLVSSLRQFLIIENFRFGKALMNQIKSGELNNSLIKPVKEIPFIFSGWFGSQQLNLLYALITLVLGLLLSPPLNFLAVIYFIPFCAIALLISLSFNIFLGVIAFYTTEASGIKNVLNHITRILSGSLIPITFFPDTFRTVAEVLPFSMMIFTPITILTDGEFKNSVTELFISGVFWAILLFSSSLLLWKRSLRKYEAIGM